MTLTYALKIAFLDFVAAGAVNVRQTHLYYFVLGVDGGGGLNQNRESTEGYSKSIVR